MGEKVPNLDDKIRRFDVTPEEREDLVAFLCALTDESKRSEIPERVPSGLPVVPHVENPGRALAARYNVARGDRPVAAATSVGEATRGTTILVGPRQSIDEAVAIASPGDVVEVAAGTYHETVTVDKDRVTLRASPGARPVLDGDGRLGDAVIATGASFTMQGFEIRHYKGNGVVVENAKDVALRDLVIDDTGLYGVYPVGCTGVTVESVTATGIADAAIYVGQSRDITVRGCDAHASVTGIEIENSLDALVEGNFVHDCAGGILVFVLPNNPSKVGARCRVLHNRVIENNHVNFGNPTSIVSHVPSGAGILVMAADDTEVAGNTIEGNASFGVAVTGLGIVFDEKGTTFDVGAIPERTFVHGNRFARNGAKPAKMLTDLGLAGADLLWDLSGWSNRWDEPGATRATPILEARWPEPARLAAWRILRALGRS
jgi:parallel beta-helix repeat protein